MCKDSCTPLRKGVRIILPPPKWSNISVNTGPSFWDDTHSGPTRLLLESVQLTLPSLWGRVEGEERVFGEGRARVDHLRPGPALPGNSLTLEPTLPNGRVKTSPTRHLARLWRSHSLCLSWTLSLANRMSVTENGGCSVHYPARKHSHATPF